MLIARPARYQAAQHSVPRAECQACLARCGDEPGRVEPRGDHDARARPFAWYAARTYIGYLETRPTVHAPTAWHSSERSENGCELLYTAVSELGRLWAFKGDCRHELLRAVT
eukprot:scaffold27822_cov67-Phaeocystis_antarctica.AAC.1